MLTLIGEFYMKEIYVHFYWTSANDIKYDVGRFLSVRCDKKGYVYYGDLIFKLRQIYSDGKITFPVDSREVIKFCDHID